MSIPVREMKCKYAGEHGEASRVRGTAGMQRGKRVARLAKEMIPRLESARDLASRGAERVWSGFSQPGPMERDDEAARIVVIDEPSVQRKTTGPRQLSGSNIIP